MSEELNFDEIRNGKTKYTLGVNLMKCTTNTVITGDVVVAGNKKFLGLRLQYRKINFHNSLKINIVSIG